MAIAGSFRFELLLSSSTYVLTSLAAVLALENWIQVLLPVTLSQYGCMGWFHTGAYLLKAANCRTAACRNSTLPDTSHRNGTLLKDSRPAGTELRTAESRSVTAQEGLGYGYIRRKLLPLVDMLEYMDR